MCLCLCLYLWLGVRCAGGAQGKLREELACRESELGAKSRELDEAEKARASLAQESEGLRRQLEGLRKEVQDQQEEHALALSQAQQPKDMAADPLRFTTVSPLPLFARSTAK